MKNTSKRMGDLQPGDILLDGLDREVLVVDRVLAARARGYVVVQGKALPDGRSRYPNGQTSGHRDQVVRVNEC